MKFKNTKIMVVLAMLGLTLFAGCGNIYSPKKVVEMLVHSALTGDYKKFKKTIYPNARKMLSRFQEMIKLEGQITDIEIPKSFEVKKTGSDVPGSFKRRDFYEVSAQGGKGALTFYVICDIQIFDSVGGDDVMSGSPSEAVDRCGVTDYRVSFQ